MWYKVKELKSKGLNCVQIAHELGLHRHTVEKYVRMSLEEFQASQAYERDFKYKLDIFEEEVKNELIRAPYLSSRRVHDHLREHHADFPEVSEKTVFNLVMRVRDKYRIPKTYEENIRPLEKLPESAPGMSMQVDFGEYWMHRNDTRRVKVYFFVAVMSYSRHKFTYFSRSPFTSELTLLLAIIVSPLRRQYYEVYNNKTTGLGRYPIERYGGILLSARSGILYAL